MAVDNQKNLIINHPLEAMRVLGPPGSGKTELLVQRSIALRAMDEGATIVTYSRGSYERIVEKIVSEGSAGLGPIPVYTFNQMARRIIESCGLFSAKIIGDIEECVIIESSIRRLCSKLGSTYKKVASSRRFQEALAEVFHVIQQNGIGGEQLQALIAKREHSSRIGDLTVLYEDFINTLNNKRLTSYYRLSYAALEALGKSPGKNPFLDTRVFLIDDFQDVDRGQFELLKALAPCGGKAVLNVFGDPTGARFGFRGTEHSILTKEFDRVYDCKTFNLPVGAGKLQKAAHLIRALLKETIAEDCGLYWKDHLNGSEGKEKPKDYNDAASLGKAFMSYNASDEYEEVALVGSMVRGILDQERYKPEEIAIIARDKIQYEPLLSLIARQYGFLLDSGHTGQKVFETFVLGIMSLLMDDSDRTSQGIILTSPLRENLERLLSTHFDTSKDSDGWDTIALLRSFSMEITRLNARAWFKKVMDDIIIPVVKELDAVEKDPSPEMLCRELAEEFDRYCRFARRVGGSPNVSTFLNLVFSKRSDEVGTRRGRVGLYSCHETSGRFFPIVFILGCSDTLFPRLERVDSLIPWDELGRVVGEAWGSGKIKLFKTRSVEDQMRDQHALLLHSIKRALDALVITSPRRFGEEGLSAPSEVIELSVGEYQQDASSMLYYPPVIQLSKMISMEDSKGLEEKAGFTGFSLWMQRKIEKKPFSLRRFPLSPSSMKTYCSCPRKFLYSRVMKIREKRNLGMQVGSVFHKLAKRLFDKYQSRSLIVDAIGRGEHEEIMESLLADEAVDPESLLGRIFKRVLKRLSESLADFERSIEEDIQRVLPEQKLHFESGGFTFTGQADRMDFLSGERIQIIDYKTASRALTTGKGIRDRVVASRDNLDKQDWQVPLYSWSVKSKWKRLPERFSYYCLGLEKEPLITSLFLLKNHEEMESRRSQFHGKSSRSSYLLEEELEGVIYKAVSVAEDIFSERESFARTDIENHCRNCSFNDVCVGRERGT